MRHLDRGRTTDAALMQTPRSQRRAATRQAGTVAPKSRTAYRTTLVHSFLTVRYPLPITSAARVLDRRLNARCRLGFTGGVDRIRPDVWVHPAARVRRSVIAGDGLFIDEPVAAGTPLIRFGGTAVTTAELHELFDEADVSGTYIDTIAIGLDCHVVLPADSIAHYGNHSCDPTMWLGAPLELVARVDLTPGAGLRATTA